MDHADHVALIRDGVPASGGTWADLGSGRGAFTLALADLIGATGTIYSVDQDQRALDEQARALRAQFPTVRVHPRRADFSQPLELPPLDGIVLANSLHFIPARRQSDVVRLLRGYLKPAGRLILVEYNTDQGTPWVPHPFSFRTWERLAADAGFAQTRLLATRPSRFLREIYSAASFVVPPGESENR